MKKLITDRWNVDLFHDDYSGDYIIIDAHLVKPDCCILGIWTMVGSVDRVQECVIWGDISQGV